LPPVLTAYLSASLESHKVTHREHASVLVAPSLVAKCVP
jgi:hypothetical protein